ncbi:M48 family metalloprotease [Salmonella enterica]|nr:M48 family metalloprotease [Salmonella enterica]EJH7441501.1 M48 family metalloprotease [Salmonella enterica]EJH7880902.1 M48 family metalloprotease [Salmonella enterica]EJI6713608.1 M48 family metalloprotease [Salmonella enterica]
MKNTRRLFIIPVCIILYSLWQIWRASDGGLEHDIIIRILMSSLAIFMGFIALLVVASATAFCARSARVSQRSQEILIQQFNRCRRLLPFLMTGEIVFCGLAVICMSLSELAWMAFHVKMNAGGIKAVLLIVLLIGAILWLLIKSLFSIRKCFALFKAEDSVVMGKNISVEQAPKLWQWVYELTQRAHLTRPDNIVVGFFDCFYVTANAVQIEGGERLTGNTLYLPLTYMALLDEDEIAAVVGHELGHFTGEDTQYSLRFAPLYSGMVNSLEQMANNAQGNAWTDYLVLKPSLDMAEWFLYKFHETVNHWSRIREHAADKMGAEVSSPEAFATALLRISVLDEFVQRHLVEIIRGNVTCDDWLTSVVAAIQQSGTADPVTCIDSQIAHPMDSHPTTRERIAALGVALDDVLFGQASRPVQSDDDAFLATLLPDMRTLCLSLSQTITAEIAPQRAAHRAELEEDARQAMDATTFWMGAKMPWGFIVGGIVLLAVGIDLLVLSNKSGVGLLLCVVGIVCALMGKSMLSRSKKPLFGFAQDRLISPYFQGSVPLKNIVACNITVLSGSSMIELPVCEGYQPAMTTRRFMQIVRFDNKKQAIMILVSGTLFQQQGDGKIKLDENEILRVIGQYLASAHAREELQGF